MPVPFELPDKCNISRLGFPEPIALDVPCRQVPNMVKGRQTNDRSANMMWTHWVDFEPGVDVQDNAYVGAGGVLVEAAAGGDTLEFIDDDSWLVLHVVWVEDRYTNTDGAYQRAYCVRTFRET